MLIPNERILHMKGVAEYMYEHAEEYGCENKDEMYVLGLLHDIGYLYSKNKHEEKGGELIGRNKYGELIKVHGLTPQEYMEKKGYTEEEIPKELILLWTADMKIDLNGKEVGYKTRLNNIGIRHGVKSKAYQISKETIKWLERKEEHDRKE